MHERAVGPGSPATADRPPRRRPARVLLVAVGAAVLVVGVLLVRPGTAVTEADLVPAPSGSAEPSEPAADPVPAAADLAAGPFFGIALGDSTARLEALGYRLGTPAAGCTPVVPGPLAPGPGQGFTAWAVDGRLASVALDVSAGSPSPLAELLGRKLADLAAAPAALRQVSLVPVRWSDRPVAVSLVELPGRGVQVLAADVRPDGAVDHVELSIPAADRCDAVLSATSVSSTLLGFAGWGPVVLGTDETSLREEVVVSPAEGRVLRVDPDTGAVLRRCRTLVVHDPPGPASVLLVDGMVRSVSIDAGGTEAGLRGGDGAAAVTRAYPDITTAYVESRWEQGLAVSWQYPEGELRVYGGPDRAPVPGLDAEIDGPGPVVVRVEAGGSC